MTDNPKLPKYVPFEAHMREVERLHRALFLMAADKIGVDPVEDGRDAILECVTESGRYQRMAEMRFPLAGLGEKTDD